MNGQERISFDALVEMVKGLKESVDKKLDELDRKSDEHGEVLSGLNEKVKNVKEVLDTHDAQLDTIKKTFILISQIPKVGGIILAIVIGVGGFSVIYWIVEHVGKFLKMLRG